MWGRTAGSPLLYHALRERAGANEMAATAAGMMHPLGHVNYGNSAAGGGCLMS